MTVKFQVAWAGTGNFTDPTGLKVTMNVIKRRMRKLGGPYRLIVDGNKSPWRNWGETLERIRIKLNKAKPGTRFIIDSKDSTVSIAVRAVEVNPPVKIIDTVGNDRIDKIYSHTLNHFSGLSNLGIFACRRVDGTNIWSQHAYANAWDIGASTMEKLVEVADWIVAQAKTGEFKGIVSHVIVANRIWQPSTGWRYYGGNYHYHVHVDAYPNYTHWPSCA